MNSQVQELAQTLLASKLAASPSEAQRMAKEMLGVAEKVHADNNKEHIYAVHGFTGSQKSAAATSFKPTPSPEAAAFSSSSSSQPVAPASQATASTTQRPQQLSLDNPVMIKEKAPSAVPSPHPTPQEDAVQEPLSQPSPTSSVDTSSFSSSPTENSSFESSVAHSSLDATSTEAEAVQVELETHHHDDNASQAPQSADSFPSPSSPPQSSSASSPELTQQASLLATEALKESSSPLPEDRFAEQFAGKTLSELSASETSSSNPTTDEQPSLANETTPSSDFLHLRSQPETQQNASTASESSLSTGWPSEANSSPSTTLSQTEAQQTSSAPQKEENTSQEEQKPVEKPKAKMPEEEVDLSKVFNFSK